MEEKYIKRVVLQKDKYRNERYKDARTGRFISREKALEAILRTSYSTPEACSEAILLGDMMPYFL